MSDFNDKEKLTELGLENSLLGKVEELELRGEDVARGYAALDISAEEFVRDHEPLFLTAKAAEEMDFRVAYFEERPQLVRVWTPEGPFHVLSANDDTSVYESEDGEYYLDFARLNTPVALVNEAGEGLFLEESDHRLRIGQLLRVPESLSLTVELSSPVETWLESSDDPWVCELVRQKIALASGWEYLAALGTLHRLEKVTDKGRRDEFIKQMLTGTPPAFRERALQWADALDAQSVDKLTALTLGALEQLQDEMEVIRQDYEEGANIDRQKVLDMLHLRDDIESALVLLSRTDKLETLAAPVESADQVGAVLARDLHLEFDFIDDERIRRASQIDPTAWWGRLAYPEDDPE